MDTSIHGLLSTSRYIAILNPLSSFQFQVWVSFTSISNPYTVVTRISEARWNWYSLSATIAYDNMCNLDRLRAVETPLPLPSRLDKMWMSVTKIIDVFHFCNHVGADCQRKYSPEHVKRLNPSWNTQAGEETFTWLSRFKHIVCSMLKHHHLFFIHRMVVSHNAYTVKCYKHGRKHLLPKAHDWDYNTSFAHA